MTEIQIDHTKRIPSSTQIARILRSRIHNKEIEAGEQLPPVKDIAKVARVGSNTVRAAFSVLEKEGLVESTRGKGTFVTGKTSQESSTLLADVREEGSLKIAIASAHHGDGSFLKDHSLKIDSVRGILKECEHINANVEILTNSFNRLDKEAFWQALCCSGIQGLVWIRPSGMDWEIIEYLHSKKLPVVVTRRSSYESDIVSVQSDYESAGFVSADYFIEHGVNKIVYFTHIKPGTVESYILEKNSTVPFGLGYGLERALDAYSDKEIDVDVTFVSHEQPAGDQYGQILEKIENCETRSGLLFGNAACFIHFLEHSNGHANELLSGRPFLVVSNSDLNSKMAHYVRGLDFKILSDPFEDIGRVAVQKLSNLISGYVASSTTLVKVHLKSFWSD